MGNDGGSIPRREEMVRQKPKPERKDRHAENVAKWKLCCLSQQPLRAPVVVCPLGRLYNKEALIEQLLRGKSTSHIRSLKDVVTLRLTENRSDASTLFGSTSTDSSSTASQWHTSAFVCPITGVEMCGTQPFSYLRQCGCVFSTRGLVELLQSSSTCPNCHKEGATRQDVVALNPPEAVQQELLQELHRVRTAKRKRKVEVVEAKKPANDSSTIRVNDAKSVVRRVEKRRVEESDGQKKAGKSETYKNLFTSSESARKQDANSAHWVTYNPYYN